MRSVVEKVIRLQSVDIFAEIETEHLAVLATAAREVHALPDDVLFREHEPADSLFLVLEGAVRLHRDGRTITEAGPGEAFGTWALLNEETRLVTATVTAETRLLRIDREDFVDLMADHVQIAQGVLRAVSTRLRGLAARTT